LPYKFLLYLCPNNAKMQEIQEPSYAELRQDYEELKLLYENIVEHSTFIENELDETLQLAKNINQNLTASITYAKRIQEAMLPKEEYVRTFLPDFFVFFRPRDIVSGDFYWCQKVATNRNEIDKNRIVIAAVDCTGHGVPGAFMSMLGQNLLDDVIVYRGILQADEILYYLNQGIMRALRQQDTDNQDGMDMSIAVIDKEEKIIEVAAAKNPVFIVQPSIKLVMSEDETRIVTHRHEPVCFEVKGDKFGIGGSRNGNANFNFHRFKLQSPTTIYLFSDGYQDQFGAEGKKFMIKNFRNLLYDIHAKPMTEQHQILEQTFNDWVYMNNKKVHQTDDVLVIGIKL
jgi:serine phosphatase RsbU (regulator of sigma subunit)